MPPTLSSLRAALTAMSLLAVAVPGLAQAQGLAGAYLAAREAGVQNDFAASITYLERLHAADPQNAAALETLVVSAFSIGAVDTAARNAQDLRALAPGNRAAAMVLLAGAFHDQDYAAALGYVDATRPVVHPLIDGLAQAWAQLGAGRMSEAQESLDRVAGIDGMRSFALYCRALALALVGDVEGAVAVIEDPRDGVADSLNRRGYIAYAQLLGLTERYDDAVALIDRVFASGMDPAITRMRAAYADHHALPFDLISTPAQGMAEVFAVMASAMSATQNTHEALIYAQAAVWINPDLTDAQILIGQILEDLDQPEAAAAAYARIPQGSVFDMAARMGRAQVLEAQGQAGAALDELLQLAADNPDSFAAQTVLGDALRRDAQFPQAVAAYTRAIDILRANGLEPEWQTWFARAVAYSRTDDWAAAESDFRAALAVEPDQPTVLNYLGYSLIERGEKLVEALDMIRRAVAAEPDSGYIVDSLAWAQFRLGHYEDAVPNMERAVELQPTDAILNDHLGDVYWAVGRHREARFQWRRALSFAPADDLDEDRLRRKLEVGLDAVRAEAGEPPLHPDQ
ncbi:MAG: tetratricopeptide repeat protein [Rhodobacter sp.]|uniref:tetratricopeptide repeat protein n=1 Tax=Pararhodobacter sp. TaxID=2127056 RepID=UPI002CF1EB5A|nr:tetratricopeptide repeat protein [Pararhodobacter sp.]MCC0074877.1 tetratricopeptide repeat protein [Rhodobacter sp.]HPD90877.1 tetratricopeptide repeat protein [Pararhodobacter sp.]